MVISYYPCYIQMKLCSKQAMVPIVPPYDLLYFMHFFLIFSSALKKRSHSQLVCSLFQKWAFCWDRMIPFFLFKKRSAHYGTVWPLLKRWANGFCVRPLFSRAKKSGFTLSSFAYFFKSELSSWAWYHFLQGLKKGVSLWYRLFTFSKVNKRYHSEQPFFR